MHYYYHISTTILQIGCILTCALHDDLATGGVHSGWFRCPFSFYQAKQVMRRNHRTRRKSDEEHAKPKRYEGACIAMQPIAGERYEHPWELKYITQSSSITGVQDLCTTIIDLHCSCCARITPSEISTISAIRTKYSSSYEYYDRENETTCL